MDLDREEIRLMLVDNYALLLQVSTLLWPQEIHIDACVEHIKYRADIFSIIIRCFQIIWIKKEQLKHVC